MRTNKDEIRTGLHKLVDAINNEARLRQYYTIMNKGYISELKELTERVQYEDKDTLSDHVTA